MTEAKSLSYTEQYGQDTNYFSLKYSIETAAGLLELDETQVLGFMQIWGRPEKNPPVRSRDILKVCWLDFEQCQFLADLGFQHHMEVAEQFMTELIRRLNDRYPTALQHLWDEEGLKRIWEAQQAVGMPDTLLVVEEHEGDLQPSNRSQRFLDRIVKYDDNGIILDLILQPTTVPGDQPILIHPGRKSGYPTINAHLIEFIGGLYRKHGFEAVKEKYEGSPLTETEARSAIDYTANHYIEPMPSHRPADIRWMNAMRMKQEEKSQRSSVEEKQQNKWKANQERPHHIPGHIETSRAASKSA